MKMLEPAPIDGAMCDRIEISRPDGKGVFWIDRKSSVLRRFEYPIERLKQYLADGQVENLALIVDFRLARLGEPVDPKAFRFELPVGAETVESFMPPSMKLLGKKSPDFFVIGSDGKPTTLKSLAGQTVVMQFWSTDSVPCQTTLPAMNRVAESLKDNKQVRFLAVNIDPAGYDQREASRSVGSARNRSADLS